MTHTSRTIASQEGLFMREDVQNNDTTRLLEVESFITTRSDQ